MKIRAFLASLVAMPAALMSLQVHAASDHRMSLPHERPALISERATSSVVTGLAKAGERLVAVGARGVILLSDDHGQSWRQVNVPVSVTLTAVHFVDAQLGWAVGHSGIILHSADGGESWSKQFDGQAAAEAVQARAEVLADDLDEEQAWALQDYAGLLVDDGPDKPFLDVLFLDQRRGFVVGAFGLIFRTDDAGQSWEPWFEHLDNPENLHLYSLKAQGRELVLTGEQGLYLYSHDAGQTFARQHTPYAGSYFTATPMGTDAWLLAGLRGNAFIHYPGQERYQQLHVPAPVSFNAAITLDDGAALLVNQAGQVFHADPITRVLMALPLDPLPPLASIIQSGDGQLVVAGFRGPVRLENVVEASSRGVGQ